MVKRALVLILFITIQMLNANPWGTALLHFMEQKNMRNIPEEQNTLLNPVVKYGVETLLYTAIMATELPQQLERDYEIPQPLTHLGLAFILPVIGDILAPSKTTEAERLQQLGTGVQRIATLSRQEQSCSSFLCSYIRQPIVGIITSGILETAIDSVTSDIQRQLINETSPLNHSINYLKGSIIGVTANAITQKIESALFSSSDKDLAQQIGCKTCLRDIARSVPSKHDHSEAAQNWLNNHESKEIFKKLAHQTHTYCDEHRPTPYDYLPYYE